VNTGIVLYPFSIQCHSYWPVL